MWGLGIVAYMLKYKQGWVNFKNIGKEGSAIIRALSEVKNDILQSRHNLLSNAQINYIIINDCRLRKKAILSA